MTMALPLARTLPACPNIRGIAIHAVCHCHARRSRGAEFLTPPKTVTVGSIATCAIQAGPYLIEVGQTSRA